MEREGGKYRRMVREYIKVIFIPDYRVSLAEIIIPAADISEQISLAGTEASGTGNMKLMMNGAITLGTEDGANVEIHKAVGDDNIIIFGMETPEVNRLKKVGYRPFEYYNNNPVIKDVLDFLASGLGADFRVVTEHIKNNDTYMALADFADYSRAQKIVSDLYNEKDVWNRMSLMNIASSGYFAADRSINDYARDIWHTKSAKGTK